MYLSPSTICNIDYTEFCGGFPGRWWGLSGRIWGIQTWNQALLNYLCDLYPSSLFTGTRDKSGRAVAIITTRNTAWLNPHCNTTELVRLLLYLHSIPRFVMLLAWQGRQLLPCPLCLSGRWKLRQEWKKVDFIGLGAWSRQFWNFTGGNLLLGWTGLCPASILPILSVLRAHGVI